MSKKPGITLVSFNDDVALGVRYLHATLTREGFPCRIIFFQGGRRLDYWFSEDELKILFELIENDENEVFGLSFRSFLYPIAKRVTEEVRGRRDALVIWGGTHPTLMPEECIETADAVCVGEGEDAILELMQAIHEGRDYSEIKNLWVRTKQGIMRNPVRPLIQDLDSLPYPLYGNEGKVAIVGEDIVEKDPVYGMEGPITYLLACSRGCPFSCTYCCNSAFREIFAGAGSYIRKRTPENIIAELEYARENLDINFVGFRDEIFTQDKSWTTQICSLYKERIDLPFTCEVHPKTVDEELAGALTEAGLDTIVMGVQSGCERVRREVYDRHVSNKQVLKAARALHEQKVQVYYDFILDNPYETRKDLHENFQLLLDIPRPNCLYLLSLVFFPKAKITERALKENVIKPEEVAGAAEKPIKPFPHTFRYSLNRDHAFYAMLFWLSALKFSFRYLLFYSVRLPDEPHPVHVMPVWLLRKIEGSKLLYNHPDWLARLHLFFIKGLNRLIAPVRWSKTGLALVLRGRFRELAARIRARRLPTR